MTAEAERAADRGNEGPQKPLSGLTDRGKVGLQKPLIGLTDRGKVGLQKHDLSNRGSPRGDNDTLTREMGSNWHAGPCRLCGAVQAVVDRR